jgi:SET domain-containing protein
MSRFHVAPSAIHGHGLFSGAKIAARRKLGELTGTIITVRQARKRARGAACVTIVEFEDGFALDASSDESGFRYVNHSCTPNTYMRRIHHRVEFYSLRPIGKGDELTCDYGETHHEGSLPCRCGSPLCRERI